MPLTLETLLGRGYFPQELPPPFNTTSLASFIVSSTGKPVPFIHQKNRPSKPEIYSLARTGTPSDVSYQFSIQFTSRC